MIPVYVDDEGTPARDVVMIDRGRLTGFMHSRETAARLGQAPTGNARAYNPNDEPLVRMRNTAILPGSSKLAQMIEGVDDGYLLLKTSNGQADSTTEFMFGITLAYEIRDGKVGRAVRATTVSGSAIKVLQSVDAVSATTCTGAAAATAARSSRWWCRWAGRRCARARTWAGSERMAIDLHATAERVLALLRQQGFDQAQVERQPAHLRDEV